MELFVSVPFAPLAEKVWIRLACLTWVIRVIPVALVYFRINEAPSICTPEAYRGKT
jgi:hypothetical protein